MNLPRIVRWAILLGFVATAPEEILSEPLSIGRRCYEFGGSVLVPTSGRLRELSFLGFGLSGSATLPILRFLDLTALIKRDAMYGNTAFYTADDTTVLVPSTESEWTLLVGSDAYLFAKKKTKPIWGFSGGIELYRSKYDFRPGTDSNGPPFSIYSLGYLFQTSLGVEVALTRILAVVPSIELRLKTFHSFQKLGGLGLILSPSNKVWFRASANYNFDMELLDLGVFIAISPRSLFVRN